MLERVDGYSTQCPFMTGAKNEATFSIAAAIN
jgi:hypothetical protein